MTGEQPSGLRGIGRSWILRKIAATAEIQITKFPEGTRENSPGVKSAAADGALGQARDRNPVP